MRKEPTSFSIYACPRPVRTAFIVDPEKVSEEVIDAIFDFNLFHWGGRYNPIIPVVDNTITDSYWELLKFCDPDIVYSCLNLDDSLLQRIKRWISPHQIEFHREIPERHHLTTLYHQQIDIEHIAENYKTDPLYFSKSATLPICSRAIKWEYRRFFQRNFGLIEEYSKISHLDSFTKLAIGDDSKPEEFLSTITNAKNLVFPVDFCKASVAFPETLRSHMNDNFTIVIGDSIWSWIYMWNTIFLRSDWQRKKLSQICIPATFLESDRTLDVTKKFLESRLPWSSSQPPRIEVVSFDKTEEELKNITLNLNKEICAYPTIKQLKKAEFQKVERSPRNIKSHALTQHHQVFGNEVFIPTPMPDFLSSPEASYQPIGRHWMVDLKIEYRPENFFYTNIKYWWRLPKYRDVALSFGASGRSRITLEGFVSLGCVAEEKNLKIMIPSDGQVVFAALLSGSNGFNPYFHREKKAVGPHWNLEISDKGRYLRGFVNLFPSLWHATEFCENRYWRSVVESMCRNTEESDQRTTIRNKLDKDLPKWVEKFRQNPQEVKDLIELFVMKKAKELKQVARETMFEFLLRRLEKERMELKQQDEYKDVASGDDVCRQDLIEALSALTNWGLFFQGIKPRCNACGSSFSYDAGEIKSELTCKGCKSKLQLPVEINWTYRLNELVLSAVAYHGVIPVVWSLGDQLHESHDSFIYMPNVELLSDSKPRKSLGDLDLVFIRDGLLVIGEVKTSAEEFDLKQIADLSEICKIVLPDIVLLAAFQGSRDKLFMTAKQLTTKLEHTGIQVKTIYPQDHVFQPSYHI